MDIPIVYEDDDLLVINKPPGIVVNRAESVKGETVQDWIEANQRVLSSRPPSRDPEGKEAGFRVKPGMTDDKSDFYDRAGIVHRIDKETSGILVIAKTPEAFADLQGQFKERRIKKTYLALVHGLLVPPEGEICAPVGRLPWNRERFGVVPGGKEAVTRYKVLQHYSSSDPASSAGESRSLPRAFPSGSRLRSNNTDEYCLVELYPETGRTHQIRVHLKYINHPIVGDYLYAGRKTARSDRLWAPRVMLHAWKLTLLGPSDGRPIALTAPIPRDLHAVIGRHFGILEEGYAPKEKTTAPLT